MQQFDVIFEIFGRAVFEVAEVAEVKQPRNPKRWKFSIRFFDKIVIKRDFLKMNNLYEPSAPVRKYSEVSTTDTHILYWSHNSESQKGKGK